MALQDIHVRPEDLPRAAQELIKIAARLQGTAEFVDERSRLPMGALGGVGEFARWRYNGMCSDAGSRIGALAEEAKSMATKLLNNAVGYVVTEKEIAESVSRLDSHTRLYAGWRKNEHPPIRDWLSQTILVLGPISTPVVFEAFRGEVIAASTAPTVGEASQGTAAMLRTCSRLSLAATVAAVAWSVSALITSDQHLDHATGAWEAVAKEVGEVSRELPAVSAQLADWEGMASQAAGTKFKDFQESVKAVADDANRIANGMIKLVDDLNKIYWRAFFFVAGQCVLLGTLAVAAAFPACTWARATIEWLGAKLHGWIVGIINLLAAALAAGWLSYEVGTGSTQPVKHGYA